MANLFDDFELDLQTVHSSAGKEAVCTHEDTTCIYCGGDPTGTCINTYDCHCGTIAPCLTRIQEAGATESCLCE